MQNVKNRLATELAKECKSMDDVHNMLRDLFKDTIQKILEAEMDAHLGYEKHDLPGIFLATVGTDTVKRLFRPKWAEQKLRFPVIVTASLNHKSSRNTKLRPMNWKNKLLPCMLRACPPGI
ncbi:hypothetical protein P378_19420 [Desulforamulus profundi]|uniref:Transposase n=1 Tax=Desulforamulus profundi TaxID=1383067 RepID=A0A2C6MBP1_9FIRM|nr:hypothetical protein P378_19420 [Desulforamulus profundi]